jgi:uncharacterized flavoprotein (TIGR03862 family)
MSQAEPPRAVVIGAGPAGLRAAEVLGAQGIAVDVFDAMPSPARKLLQAGIGGLNLTHSEAHEAFCSRYGEHRPQLQAMLDRYSPGDLRAWVHGLGIDTFVGSSGRVFPRPMKAAPLLRQWLQRLRGSGVHLHMRHRWLGWDENGALRLLGPEGEFALQPQATVLALGGASWPRLGSDGAWVPLLAARGVKIAALQSANCGFEVNWSDYLRTHFAGTPVKTVALGFTDLHGQRETRPGELLITREGVEGGLIYAFSRRLREQVQARGAATFELDLVPARTLAEVHALLAHPRGRRSLSSHLKSRLGLAGVKLALLHEAVGNPGLMPVDRLAATIKSLPISVHAPRPLAGAISTAGGLAFEALDGNLMLRALPGVFAAGEMLDWEAPTGGYLLTACLATGAWAGEGAVNWLKEGQCDQGAAQDR